MHNNRKWQTALSEHDAAVAAFSAALDRVPPAAWHMAPRPAQWTPAAVALHVALSYEFGCEAAVGAAAMRLRVPPLAAWASRTFLLPIVLRTGRFPAGAAAPREVRPDLAEAASIAPAQARRRLHAAATRAAVLLAEAAEGRPVPPIVHAYFGALSPERAMRLLAAHTRHHIPGLQPSGPPAPAG